MAGRRVLKVEIIGDAASLSAMFRRTDAGAGDLDDRLSRLSTTLTESRRSADGAGGGFANFARQAAATAGGIGLFKAASAAIAWPVMIEKLRVATAGLASLGMAAIGVVGSLGPLVGLIPALGVGLASLGQGFGVVALATGGVGAALKAYTSQQKTAGAAAAKSGASAKSAAQRQEAAAESVRSATVALADAQRSAAAGQASALANVESAERSLERAQESARDAQEALTQARRDEAEELEDLRLSAERSAISQQRAEERLAEARDELSGATTEKERRAALLDVADAELSLREVIERRGDEQERLAHMDATGIEGSAQVVAALRGVRDANTGVADSDRALADAHTGVVEAQVQGARSIADATRSLEQAMRSARDGAEDMGASGAGAVDQFAAAMAKLSPAAQSLVRTLLGFSGPVKAMRDTAAAGLFPGVERGLLAIKPLFTSLLPVIDATARALGSLAADAGGMLASLGPELSRFGMANVPIMRSLGSAVIALVPGFLALATAAQPLMQWLADLALQGSKWVTTALVAGEKTGALAGFFEKTKAVVITLGGILAGLATGLFRIGQAGSEAGGGLLESLRKAMGGFAAWTAVPENAEMLKRLAEAGADVARALGRFATEGLLAVLRAADQTAPKLAPLIDMAREKLIPAFERLVSTIDGDFIAQLIELGAVMIDLAGSFGTIFPIVRPILAVLTDILGFVVTAIDKVPGLGMAIGGLGSALTLIQFGQMLGGLSKLATAMGITPKLGLLKTGLTALKGGFTTLLPGLASAAAGLWAVVAPALIAAAPFILIGLAVAALAALFVIHFDTIKAAAGWVWEKMQQVWDGILGIFRWVIDKVGGFVREWGVLLLGPIGLIWKFRDEIFGAVQRVIGFFGDLVGNVAGAMGRFVGAVGDKVGDVVGFFTGLPGKILGGLGNVGTMLVDAGRRIVEGLGEGLKAGWDFVKKAWNWIIEKIPGGLADFLKMASPSRLMRDLAINIPKGVALGIHAGGPEVSRAMAAMAARVASTPLTAGDISGATGRLVPFVPGAAAGSAAPASSGHAGSDRRGPLQHVENQYINETVDIDVMMRRVEFAADSAGL